MKPPSKNISTSLRSQTPGGRAGEPVRVSKQKPPSMHPTAGEGGTSPPPGAVHERSTKAFAGAVGGIFGNGKV